MARTTAWWLAGVVGFALALEVLFRILPVSTSTETGYYTDPLILSYPPHHHWNVSTGWDLRNSQTLEANNWGYAAARNFERNKRAVALVGDSFVEASMLAAADRPGVQLEHAIGSRPVYAMGSPGTALLDYAERIRFAHEQFDVHDFVVLMERGDVLQSLCGSGNVKGPCLDPETLDPRIQTLPPPGSAKRLLRHSALAQYLSSQLKFNPQTFLRQAFSPSQSLPAVIKGSAADDAQAERISTSEAAMAKVDTITNAFLARVKPHIRGQLVIVIDSDRHALHQGQMTPDPARTRFMQLARASGATVIDTAPLFQTHFARSSLKLDVGPYDGHLNALGVRLITQAAASALNSP